MMLASSLAHRIRSAGAAVQRILLFRRSPLLRRSPVTLLSLIGAVFRPSIWPFGTPPPSQQLLTWIILSRSRALQLDALLRSMQAKLPTLQRCILLYRCDSERHRQAYADVIRRHPSSLWRVKEETCFETDLRSVVASVSTPLVAFLVDDDVFIHKTDLAILPLLAETQTPFSLRLGRRITHCQTLAIDTPSPHCLPLRHRGSGLLLFPWEDGPGDWSIRYSLDGNIVPIEHIRTVLSDSVDIRGPQTFELLLCYHRINSCSPYGFCFAEPILVNLAINRTSTESLLYPHGDAYTCDDLLAAYEQGFQISLSVIEELKPAAPHIITDIHLEQRPA